MLFSFPNKTFPLETKKKTTKFCLFVQDANELQNTLKQKKKKVKYSTFKLDETKVMIHNEKKGICGTLNKNRRKNSIINPTDDIEVFGEFSFGQSRKKFYNLGEIVPQK